MITSTPCQKALWGSDCFASFRRKKRRLARFFLQWQVLVFEWWPIAYTFRQLKHSVDKATTAVRWCNWWCTKTYSDWHISFVTWHVLIPLFPWHCRTMIFFDRLWYSRWWTWHETERRRVRKPRNHIGRWVWRISMDILICHNLLQTDFERHSNSWNDWLCDSLYKIWIPEIDLRLCMFFTDMSDI